MDFLAPSASRYPTNHAMFLVALLEHEKPPEKITVILDEQTDKKALALSLPSDALIRVLHTPTKEYPLKNGKTTYYVCLGNRCLPPTNDLHERSKTDEH